MSDGCDLARSHPGDSVVLSDVGELSVPKTVVCDRKQQLNHNAISVAYGSEFNRSRAAAKTSCANHLG